MTDEQSISSCGCVWERSEHGDVIVAACIAHLAPVLRAPDGTEERIPDISDRVQRILDLELDAMVAEACGGHRVARIRPVDPYQVKR